MATKNNIEDMDRFRVPDDRLTCAPFSFEFETTEDVDPLESHVFIGQPRAEKAFKKGFGTPGHIFVSGVSSISSALLENIKKETASSMSGRDIFDLVGVHNFDIREKPAFIELGKGQAVRLKKDVARLLEELKEKIPALLEGDDFKGAEKELRDRAFNENQGAWDGLAGETESNIIDTEGFGEVAFACNTNHQGVTIFPIVLAEQRRPLTPEEYSNLKKEEQEKIDEMRKPLMEKVSVFVNQSRKREQEAEEEVAKLKREFVDKLFVEKTAGILKSYNESVFAFIEGLRGHTLDHIKELFFSNDSNSSFSMAFQPHSDPFLPFKIIVHVDNSKTEGVPVIEHRNVDFECLFGEISYVPGPGGAPLGGHTIVHTGLISEANHGVLVLLARDVFGRPGIWEKLKSVLETKRLDIGRGSPSFFSNGNTKPETLHVDLKLVLVGDRDIYNFLNSPGIKEQFDEIFKTVVEFDWIVPRSEEVIDQLAELVRSFCDREKLPHVRKDGVEELIKYLSRKAENQNKFSLDFRSWKNILNEAAWLAGKEAEKSKKDPDSALITGANIRQAISDKVYELSLIRDKIYEMIENGDITLMLSGSEVGQVNALAVYDLGYIAFGSPTRITAKTFSGTEGIISIEREVRMSGRTHDKGILIFSGYLGGKYAQESPLSFSASLSFEQSYSGVDGDSASSTELYAILSSLSGLPLRQEIAVTGSVDQNGDIQPIGGANQKIEGFFDICSALELTGTQGVIIPHQNVKNLVLRDDVIEAIKQGMFHVYAIKTIEDGMEILTCKKMGEKIKSGDDKGKYKKGTVNRLVTDRLRKLTAASRRQNPQ